MRDGADRRRRCAIVARLHTILSESHAFCFPERRARCQRHHSSSAVKLTAVSDSNKPRFLARLRIARFRLASSKLWRRRAGAGGRLGLHAGRDRRAPAVAAGVQPGRSDPGWRPRLCHHGLAHTALGFQQFPKESDDCSPILVRLHEDVQDVTVLVYCAPPYTCWRPWILTNTSSRCRSGEQVTVPVPRDGSIFDLRWPLANRDKARDLSSRIHLGDTARSLAGGTAHVHPPPVGHKDSPSRHSAKPSSFASSLALPGVSPCRCFRNFSYIDSNLLRRSSLPTSSSWYALSPRTNAK